MCYCTVDLSGRKRGVSHLVCLVPLKTYLLISSALISEITVFEDLLKSSPLIKTLSPLSRSFPAIFQCRAFHFRCKKFIAILDNGAAHIQFVNIFPVSFMPTVSYFSFSTSTSNLRQKLWLCVNSRVNRFIVASLLALYDSDFIAASVSDSSLRRVVINRTTS